MHPAQRPRRGDVRVYLNSCRQFCELKGIDLLRSLYRTYPEEVLKTMSLLLVSLNRPPCQSYLLSHPFLCEIIADSSTPNLEYYISVAKALALRIDSSKVSLFYNLRHSRFPLVWEAARFYNHPESLVRASTGSIVLGLLRSNPTCNIVSWRAP